MNVSFESDFSMAALQIVCFGDFQVTLAGTPVTAFQTEKVRALLAYLAVEGRVHRRSELAQFLWSGYSKESARNSLRQALHQLRQLLPNGDAQPPWLLVTRQSVQLNPDAPIYGCRRLHATAGRMHKPHAWRAQHL